MASSNGSTVDWTDRRLPQIRVRLDAIRENTRSLADRFDGELAAVTKGVAGDRSIAGAMLDGGADLLADSRIENLSRLDQRYDVPLLLLRPPMTGELEAVATTADYSVHTEYETLERLDETVDRLGLTHGAIIMVDVGDRREGVLAENLSTALVRMADLSAVDIAGIGVNFACMNGLQATERKMMEIHEIRSRAERILDRPLDTVSIGGSAVVPRLDDGTDLDGITQVRLGEAILLGREPTTDTAVPTLRQDGFEIVTQVVERKTKPSSTDGATARAAFGEPAESEGDGRRDRAIVAIGRQDIDPSAVGPVRSDVSVVGASSDHTVLDVTGATPPVSIGDRVRFVPGYGSLLQAFTSPYVSPRYSDA
ncbi:MAG: alanine racemase [Halanaeroarchaeum sp.]